MKYKIICDSSANLLKGDFPEDDIVSFGNVPLTLFVGDKAYRDDGTANIPEMMEDIKKPGIKATSSCPSPNDYLTEMMGADYYILITISSKLSGSYNSACLAKENCEHPENVFVLDSLLTAGAMELMALEAKRLVLDKFDNLIKMGRVSKLVGFIAEKFRIKPLCCGEEGEIKIKEKVRTIQGVLKRLVINIGNLCPIQKDKICIISHTLAKECAESLKKEITSKYNFDKVTIRENNALCSFYAMDGGLIACFG